jgi:ubiquinone/menaquinone biosynthesis C-methylase UbiE
VSFISFRRYYLDGALDDVRDSFKGFVLDVGGKKQNRRGSFQPPYSQVDKWVFLNNDGKSEPDILANLPEIPIEDNIVDVIICTEVLEYIYDYKKMLSECHRVLKKDGILILSIPFMHPLHSDFECDYYRFTETLIKNELTGIFTIVHFQRLGSVFSVIYDLLRSYFVYQSKSSTPTKLAFSLLTYSNRIFKIFDKNFFKNNKYINTGFIVIGKK